MSIVEDVVAKVAELKRAIAQLEAAAQTQKKYVTNLETLLKRMAVGEEDLDNNDYMQRGSVDDNATFRAVSVLTAVYQTIDHMLEPRFQDKGRGYYEREIALRFPNISSAQPSLCMQLQPQKQTRTQRRATSSGPWSEEYLSSRVSHWWWYTASLATRAWCWAGTSVLWGMRRLLLLAGGRCGPATWSRPALPHFAR